MAKTQASVKQLRQFGFLVGGIFGVMGLWPLVWRHQPVRSWALGLAVALIVPALVAPRILAPVHRAWMALGEVLAWLVSHDPMRRKYDRAGESYRIRCKTRPGTHMLRQF